MIHHPAQNLPEFKFKIDTNIDNFKDLVNKSNFKNGYFNLR